MFSTSCRARVYITRQIPQKGLELLTEACNVSFWDSADPAPTSELLTNIPGTDVLVCMPSDRIDQEILKKAGPSLKIIATMSEDTNHIDTNECLKRNIRVLTLPKVSVEAITQLTVSLLRIATLHWIGKSASALNINQLLQSKDMIQATKEDAAYCVELSNRTIGIVGLGPLGLSVGKAFTEFGVTSILYYDVETVEKATDIGAKLVATDELFENSDIIFVCSNFKSKKNTCLFTKNAFDRMKSTTVFIDATKGLQADFIQLYQALRNGTIACAGLDVREYDTIPNRHQLNSLDNCYFLPYREFYKWDARRRLSGDLASSILETLQDIEGSKKSQVKHNKLDLIENNIELLQ